MVCDDDNDDDDGSGSGGCVDEDDEEYDNDGKLQKWLIIIVLNSSLSYMQLIFAFPIGYMLQNSIK